MSAYMDAGYGVALATLAGYAVSIVVRERTARRRLPVTGGGGAVERGGVEPAGPPASTAAGPPGAPVAPGAAPETEQRPR